jgi:hypothetical protein
MLARLRAWKAKEVQERVQQKNLFFVVPSAFMGRELAPCGLFFVLLFSLYFSLAFLFGPCYLKSTMTRAW